MTLFEFRRPDWHTHAACRGMDPNLFFPDLGGSTGAANAKHVCATCPVQDHCLDYALDNNERSGIWGGLGEPDRRKARRLRAVNAATPTGQLRDTVALQKRATRRRRAAPEHGTYSGYRRHRRDGEPACDPCRQANALYRQEWLTRQRKGGAA